MIPKAGLRAGVLLATSYSGTYVLGFIVCDRALPLIASEALQNMGSFSVFQLDPCSSALYLRT